MRTAYLLVSKYTGTQRGKCMVRRVAGEKSIQLVCIRMLPSDFGCAMCDHLSFLLSVEVSASDVSGAPAGCFFVKSSLSFASVRRAYSSPAWIAFT